MSHTELIINTKSKRGRKTFPEVLEACRNLGIELDSVNEVTRTNDLSEVLSDVKGRSPKMIIVGGGDGTLRSVVTHFAGTKIVLGVVPLGTTNNFARSLGVPIDIHESLKIIKEGRKTDIALGKIGDNYFSNVAGIGLSALTAMKVTNQRKKWLGRFAYALIGFGALLRHKPFAVVITDKDGELQFNFETHQLIVANGRYHAGKEIATDASIQSGELLIFRLGGRSKLSFAWNMLDFYFGRRRSVYKSSYLIGRNVQIKTSPDQPIELDGEVKLRTPAQIEVRPEAVRIVRK